MVKQREYPQSGYEIDFIPVGEGKKNGDAIAMRITKNGKTEIYVIDGGTKASGKALVQHVRHYYETNRVDYLISTHPDMDHISGLKVVWKSWRFKNYGCTSHGDMPQILSMIS